MQAQHRPPPNARFNSHHGAKRQLLGSPAASVAPAWKMNAQAKEKQKLQDGSKILLSRLPADVRELEVEELFNKTVGPVKEAFIIYNSQGNSKGMAVVSFQRPGDAAVARAKYDGKYVDQKRPIKIEIITDGVAEAQPQAPPAVPSLLSRLGGISAIEGSTHHQRDSGLKIPTQPRKHKAPASNLIRPNVRVVPRQRVRTKKGPRRVKKSAMQLDKEMEEYRASATATAFHLKAGSAL